jgi:hypothetical protein
VYIYNVCGVKLKKQGQHPALTKFNLNNEPGTAERRHVRKKYLQYNYYIIKIQNATSITSE